VASIYAEHNARDELIAAVKNGDIDIVSFLLQHRNVKVDENLLQVCYDSIIWSDICFTKTATALQKKTYKINHKRVTDLIKSELDAKKVELFQ
jgi:uncharacterized membrane protein